MRCDVWGQPALVSPSNRGWRNKGITRKSCIRGRLVCYKGDVCVCELGPSQDEWVLATTDFPSRTIVHVVYSYGGIS